MKRPEVLYFFERPEAVPPKRLFQIRDLIEEGTGVGTSWIMENLQRAFLIGYAEHSAEIVGTSTHKYPKDSYRKKIEDATGLDLSGYLERGYTAVRPGYRGLGIGGRLIRGLIERSGDKKVYVTIRTDNVPPLKMTHREGMLLVATYRNHRTGHELALFANQRPPLKA